MLASRCRLAQTAYNGCGRCCGSTCVDRVLRISEPSAGSSRASHTSNLFIAVWIGPLPLGSVPFLRRLAERLQVRELAVQLLLRNVAYRLSPSFARRSRMRRNQQGLVLE